MSRTKELNGKIFELTLALYRVTDFFPQGEALRKQLREKANEIFGSITEYGYSGDSRREAAGIVARLQALRGYLNIARSLRFVKSINITVLEREYDFLERFFETETKDAEEAGCTVHKETTEVLDKGHSENIVPNEFIGHNGHDKKVKGLASDTEILVKKETHSSESTSGNLSEKPSSADQKPMTIEDIFKNSKARNAPESSRRNDSFNERQKRIIEHLKSSDRAKISDLFPYFANISSKTIQRDLQDLVSKNILKKEGEKKWTVYMLQRGTINA